MWSIAKFRPATRRRLGILGTLLLGCTGSDATLPNFANVRIDPPVMQLVVGASFPLQVVAFDQDGGPVDPQELTWSSSDPGVVAVAPSGRITAAAPGTATVTAQLGPARDATIVTVLANRLHTVRVEPAGADLPVGGIASFTANGFDDVGNPFPLGSVAWSVDAPAIASIDGNGVAHALAPGSTAVRASSGGLGGSASLSVHATPPPTVASVTVSSPVGSIPVGRTSPFTAVARDGAGNIITGLAVGWASSDSAIATVSSTGVVTGVAEGTATISATIGGVNGSAGVTIIPGVSTGAWPHEPSGYTTISDQPWNNLSLIGWLLQFGTALIGIDPVAPFSAPNVLTITYPIGFVGGSAPGTETLALPMLHQVFVGTWWKPSDPWQGHPSNSNKVQYIFSNGDGSMAMIMYGHPGGPYEMRVFPDWHGAWLTPNVANVPITLGQWHQLEWLVEYGPTQDPPSGRVRWWMDGQLLGDWQNVRLSSLPLAQYKVAPVWGGAESVIKTELDFFWYDHTYVSGR